MNVVKRNSPRSAISKPRLKSPMLAVPPPRHQPKTSHLYRAPQASIRSEANGAGVDELKNKGKTRRRRPAPKFVYERQLSDASLHASDLPGPPPLTNEDYGEQLNDSAGDLNASLPDMNWRTGQYTPRKARGKLHINQGYDDFSEYMDESHRSHTTMSFQQQQQPQYNGAKTKRRQNQNVFTYGHLFQVVILLILGGYIYDSHHKVKKHKIQLKQYDEERSHLLEQMMWIDQAAKKVHQKYADLSLVDLSKESKEELTRDVKTAREDLEKLQVRIQINDRDYVHEKFGGKTVEVALAMGETSSPSHFAIALSDDTPHASATFLKQVEKHHWDGMEFNRVEPDAIEVRSRSATTSPMLEFVEPSRGCHSVGSVALRQEEDRDIIFLSLRINLVKDIPLADTEVCIGKVTRGLHLLEAKVTRK